MNFAVIYDFHPTANKVVKEIHCQPDIVVPILGYFKRNSGLISFIISCNDHKLISNISKQFDENISVHFLRNISKLEVNRLEASVGSRWIILGRLVCNIVPPLFDLNVNCFSTSSSSSWDCNKDLSNNWVLWTIKENESIVSVIIVSNLISADKRFWLICNPRISETF